MRILHEGMSKIFLYVFGQGQCLGLETERTLKTMLEGEGGYSKQNCYPDDHGIID